MAARFRELVLELVDEGRFLADVNQGLKDGMEQLIAYKRKHGREAATGKKAKLSCNLTIQFDGMDETDFSVRGDTKLTIPGPPARLTKAIETEEQDGHLTLFVRASGGTKDRPEQAVLCTQDGRSVDLETGEVIEKKGKKKDGPE